MNQSKIPDFTEIELWAVRGTLKERYGKEIETQLTNAEVALGGAGDIIWCPAIFRCAKGANFSIAKTGAQRFRAYFYYHPEHRLGTDIDSHDEIDDCVISALQIEADHLRKQKINMNKNPASPDADASEQPDSRPLFWRD